MTQGSAICPAAIQDIKTPVQRAPTIHALTVSPFPGQYCTPIDVLPIPCPGAENNFTVLGPLPQIDVSQG